MQEYYGVELNYWQAVAGILAVVGWGIIMWLTARKKTAFFFAFQFSHFHMDSSVAGAIEPCFPSMSTSFNHRLKNIKAVKPIFIRNLHCFIKLSAIQAENQWKGNPLTGRQQSFIIITYANWEHDSLSSPTRNVGKESELDIDNFRHSSFTRMH